MLLLSTRNKTIHFCNSFVQKIKVVTPISLKHNISKTVRERGGWLELTTIGNRILGVQCSRDQRLQQFFQEI